MMVSTASYAGERGSRTRIVLWIAVALVAAAAALGVAWPAGKTKTAQRGGGWPPAVSAEEMELLRQVREIALTLRAPCCPELTLAQHDSPQTLAIKNEMKEMLRAGKGRGQIVSALKAKYGDVIVGGPSISAGTLTLYVVPPVLALGLVWVVGRLVTKRRRRPAVLHLADDRWTPEPGPAPSTKEHFKKAS